MLARRIKWKQRSELCVLFLKTFRIESKKRKGKNRSFSPTLQPRDI